MSATLKFNPMFVIALAGAIQIDTRWHFVSQKSCQTACCFESCSIVALGDDLPRLVFLDPVRYQLPPAYKQRGLRRGGDMLGGDFLMMKVPRMTMSAKLPSCGSP
eukprot:3591719-Pleurochrysis_carterae.AAC.3